MFCCCDIWLLTCCHCNVISSGRRGRWRQPYAAWCGPYVTVTNCIMSIYKSSCCLSLLSLCVSMSLRRCQSVRDGRIPPTLNLTDPLTLPQPIATSTLGNAGATRAAYSHVPRAVTGADVSYAMSNSFGFGGTNACLIFKKFVG